MVKTISKIDILFIYLFLPSNKWKYLGKCHRHTEYGLGKWLKAGWKTLPGKLINGTKSSQSQSLAVHPCTGTSLGQRRFSQRPMRGKAKSCCWRGKTPGTRYRLWPDKQESSFAKKHLRVLVNNRFLSTLHWGGPTWNAVFTPGLPNHQRQGSTRVNPAKGQ